MQIHEIKVKSIDIGNILNLNLANQMHGFLGHLDLDGSDSPMNSINEFSNYAMF